MNNHLIKCYRSVSFCNQTGTVLFITCQNLALCTAALMYILSRDRLNMDLDRACLELMIKLLELDQDYSAHQDQLTAKEVEKVKEKIRKLCETVHNKHLDLENITVGRRQIRQST